MGLTSWREDGGVDLQLFVSLSVDLLHDGLSLRGTVSLNTCRDNPTRTQTRTRVGLTEQK